MTQMIDEAIRAQLVSSLSLQASPDWLQACVAYLRGKNEVITVDSVLYQVLYADLRSVVRGITNDDDPIQQASGGSFQTAASLSGISNRTPLQSFPPAVQLHQAIMASSQEAYHWKQTLPRNFGLFCQVDELFDASFNCEKRLEVGPAGSNPPPQNGNQHSRCLKVCLTDGHYCHSNNNIVHNNESNNRSGSILVGVEIGPIPNLSVHSPAGLKVLLKGPLEIRHQIMFLHPGNCIVLGGCVEELVDYQHKALKKAKQLAGVGVDPTIRALIGPSPDPLQDHEDDDEADEASGDIVTPRQQQHPQQLQEPSQPQPTLVELDANGMHTKLMSGIGSRVTSATPPSMPLPPRKNGVQPSHVGGSTRLIMSRAATSIGRNLSCGTVPHETNERHSLTTSVVAGEQHTPQGPLSPPATNPYDCGTSRISSSPSPLAGLKNGAVSRMISTINCTPATAPATNPYLRGSSSTLSNGIASTVLVPRVRGPATFMDLDQDRQGSSATSRPAANPYRSAQSQVTDTITLAQNQNHSTTPTSIATTRTGQQASTVMKSISSIGVDHSSRPIVQNMNFSNLHRFLLELVSNRDTYEAFFQRKILFRVRLCKRTGTNSNYFDVVKIKTKSGKSKDAGGAGKKYDFFISGTFWDPNDATDSVDCLSCQIHPALLDPHFEVSAAELRSISRMDRRECGRITDEGGIKVREAYFSSCYWHATLHLSADAVFGAKTSAPSDVGEQTTRDGTVACKAPKDRLVDLKAPILLLDRPEAC